MSVRPRSPEPPATRIIGWPPFQRRCGRPADDLAHRFARTGSGLVDRLHVEVDRRDAGVPQPQDRDASHPVGRSVAACAAPVPLRPDRVAIGDRVEQVRPEIGHAGEDLLPVPAHLVGTAEGTLRVRRRLTDHVLVEHPHEGLEIVLVHRIAEPPDDIEPGLDRLTVHASGPPLLYRQTVRLVVILRV